MTVSLNWKSEPHSTHQYLSFDINIDTIAWGLERQFDTESCKISP